MINTQYRLTSPLVIEAQCANLDWNSENVLIRPKMLSVCKADMRYYFGQRSPGILKQRLPLALIHEACGEVLYDPSGKLKQGQKVVMLPNIPGKDERYQENYRLDSLFRSSRADGFMQEIVSMPASQVLPIGDIRPETAAMTEFISVGTHAVKSYLMRKKRKPEWIAVWGDGALGYVVCALLKLYLPETRLTVIGTHETKLSMFSFTDEQLIVSEVGEKCRFDDTFECVGGQKSANAIRQMIAAIQPEGIINLMGVCEDPVPVETRMVLEKGLTLLGRSRSAKEDFADSIRLMEEKKFFADKMRMLVSQICPVKEIKDIHYAFGQSRVADFKVVMDWKL